MAPANCTTATEVTTTSTSGSGSGETACHFFSDWLPRHTRLPGHCLRLNLAAYKDGDFVSEHRGLTSTQLGCITVEALLQQQACRQPWHALASVADALYVEEDTKKTRALQALRLSRIEEPDQGSLCCLADAACAATLLDCQQHRADADVGLVVQVLVDGSERVLLETFFSAFLRNKAAGS